MSKETCLINCDMCKTLPAKYLTAKDRIFICDDCKIGGFVMVMYSLRGFPLTNQGCPLESTNKITSFINLIEKYR